jgi:site-specific DNA-methyltransferase (cytosine-N4-specific)
MKQLPLFESTVLKATHIAGTTSKTYDYFANKIGLSESQMEKLTDSGKGGMVSKWKRRIRFIQQTLKSKGLIERGKNLGDWQVTGKGKECLTKAPRNSCQVYFVTKHGVAFWGDASTLSLIFKNEVDLIITSPPYLLTKNRSYGSLANDEASYVKALIEHVESWLPMLTQTGSIVLNLGPSYKKDAGHQSLYRERFLIQASDKLGLELVQKFTWWSPNKMPTGHYTTKLKTHCVNAVEDFYWMSLDPKQTKANNQAVLVSYSKRFKRMALNSMGRKGGVSVKRPSGHITNEDSFYSMNNGAIPHNLLIDVPEGSNSAYSQYCKANHLPRHPAMMPQRIPEFFINYLTDKEDFVMDPFFGSGKVGLAAETSGRYWAGSELVREYLDGAVSRFSESLVGI